MREPFLPRPIVILCCAALVLATACGRPATAEGGRLVLCSSYPVYLSAMNIVADVPGIRLERLASAHEGCPHDHHLSTAEMKRLAAARVLIVHGAGLEGHLAKALQQYPDLPVIDASRGYPLLVGAAHGTNGHVWVAPSGTMHQVRMISEGLAALDPEHAARYRTNAAAYLEKLAALQTRMLTALAGVRGRRIISFHDAFPYFAADFGLTVAGVIQQEAAAALNPGELAAAIRLAREAGAQAIVAEPQARQGTLAAVARETGLATVLLDPVASGPDEPDAYLVAMEKNLAALVKNLQ